MFGAVDGIHMVMLIKLLGSDYVVWDKTSTIRFKQPDTPGMDEAAAGVLST